jgi:hypothetical protein
MLITTLQLTQMVFGIAVTVSSVVYLAMVRNCSVCDTGGRGEGGLGGLGPLHVS